MGHSDEITLRVGEIPPNSRDDLGQGIARIDATSMETLGVTEDDPIWISGEKQTLAKVKESYPADNGLGIIRIDKFTRKNAGIRLGQAVDLKPARSHKAEKIIFEIEPIISKSSILEEQVEILNDIHNEYIVDISLIKDPSTNKIKEEHKNTVFNYIHNNLSNMFFSKNDQIIIDLNNKEQLVKNELEAWGVKLDLVDIHPYSTTHKNSNVGYYITNQTKIQLQNNTQTSTSEHDKGLKSDGSTQRVDGSSTNTRNVVENAIDPAITTLSSPIQELDFVEYDGLPTVVEGCLLSTSLEYKSVAVVGLYQGDEGEGWRLASEIPLLSTHERMISNETVEHDTETRTSSKKVGPPDTIPVPPHTDIEYESLIEKTVIDHGQNAKIVRAVDPDSGTPVAIKTPSFSQTFTKTEQFLGEAERWDAVDGHDHVVTVFDWDIHNGFPWIAMEYMDGGHLGEYAGQCSLQQALWTAVKISDAVYHAHRQGVVHLDLKPENILFRSVDHSWDIPKVADWGLSRPLIEDSDSVDGLTPPYAAPETLPGSDGCLDIVTDVYQLGAVFYELITGRPPFDKSSLDISDQIKSETPTPPSTHVQVPDPVDEIILTALEKEKQDRYEDVLFLREELHEIFDQIR